jgi:PAS domain S-box-containing protein
VSQRAPEGLGLRGDARLALLAAIVDSSHDAIVGKSVDGVVTSWNPAAERMFGYSRDEMIGKPTTILAPADTVDEVIELHENLMRGGAVNNREAVGLRKDGSTFPVSVTISPIRDHDGQVVGASSIARDVTEQRLAASLQLRAEDLERTAAGLHLRAEDLERANRNLEAFTYCVSHDLRAPLRALSGFSAALLEEYGDRLDEVGRGYAERIEAGAERMAQLIDDLLHLSRISRAVVRGEAVDLCAEALSITEELQRREPDRRVSFVIEKAVWVTADRGLIRTVLENLLGNAWKFTAGRDEASIKFGTMPTSGAAQVCCYVRDDGAGFDPEYVGKLFRPFQRLHLASEFPGTGVGLASVRQIVELHGGETWAEGAVDQGATFYFTLAAGKTK